MNIGNLFLKIILTDVITFSKLDCILNQQLNRLEESIVLKLGKMFDSGFINIGCHLSS